MIKSLCRLLLALLVLVWAAPVLAAPARIAIIYDGGESTGPAELRRAADARILDATIDIYAPGDGGLALKAETDLGSYDLILLDGTAQGVTLTTEQLASAVLKTKVFVLGGTRTDLGNVDGSTYGDAATYWANRSVDNDTALIGYLVSRVLGQAVTAPVQAPIVYTENAFYHPAAPGLFNDRASFLAWYSARANGHRFDSEKPTLGLSTHRGLVQQRNLAHIDALIRAGEARGANMLTLVRRSGVNFTPLMEGPRPLVDVLLFDGEFLNLRDREAGRQQARALGLPLLMTMTSHTKSPDEYRNHPGGLAPDLTARVVNSERDGMIEPIVIGGKDPAASTRRTLPMDEQIGWRIDRALAWAKLRRADNAEKRIVFTFWSEAGGKADIGADPDDFLDIQGSLARFLPMMRERGYNLGTDALPDAQALAVRMARGASNVGSWAPGELARRVTSGEVVLVPEATYLQWYNAVPVARRTEIEAIWGPPPGTTMMYVAPNGARSIVIPRIQIGNVIVAPHPMWGYYENEKVLMSTGALPPHHQYLAFFLWLQNEVKADAWVSLFTNIVLQPGRNEGPLATDHIGIELGAIPHIHPERLGSTGGMANKRKALAQTIGWYNIVVPLENRGADSATGPLGGKILGTGPQGDVFATMVTGMLGADLEQALIRAGHTDLGTSLKLVQKVLAGTTPSAALQAHLGSVPRDAHAVLSLAPDYAARLATAPREVEAIFESLSGNWLAPGPLFDPYRRPEALPPGRGLYNFDQRAIPTPEAEAVGVRQAEALIAAHRAANDGAYPAQLALVFWSGENAKTGGVNEATALHLMGTRVVRNWRGEVTGVRLIDRAELGRPRVDVLVQTSGTYRDHFQDKVALITDAARLAAASGEPDNAVAGATRQAQEQFLARGETPERAATLAAVRVFSPAAGAYSPSIQFLAKSGDLRGDEAKMAELYTARMSHAYGNGLYGEAARPAFEGALRRMEGAALSRSSDVNGMLDHPMSAGFLGGLNLAAKALTGRQTELYVTNQRDMRNPSVQSAREALSTELRTRYFNPEWIKANQSHGYDGARTFMLATDHLDLWDSTATQMVDTSDWAEVKAIYVDDKLGLGMDAFFDRANPHAQQVMLGNLLGAADRGHWVATLAEKQQIATRMAQSVRDHGPACEAGQCRNQRLSGMIATLLDQTPEGRALARQYDGAIAQATTAVNVASGGLRTAPGSSTGFTRQAAKSTASTVQAAIAQAIPQAATPAPGSSSAPQSQTPPSKIPPAKASPKDAQSPVDNQVTGRVMREVTKALNEQKPVATTAPLALVGIALAFILGGVWLGGRRRPVFA